MSVKVEVHELADQLAGRPLAYLLTVTDEQRPHAVAVTPRLEGVALRFTDGLGRRTRANLAARPQVTLLWPPGEPGGYTLIADGRVEVEGDESAPVATFVPATAVLHRPADHGPGPAGACGSDCVPVGEP
jgi:hypothetical protein